MSAVNAVSVLEYMRELSATYSARTGKPKATNAQLADFLAIAYAENYGTATAHDLVDDRSNTAGNDPPSTDRGMWMLNSYWWKDVSDECAYDWKCATRVVSEKTQGFTTNKTQWSAFNNGNYKVHLPIAWMIIRVADARVREADANAKLTAATDTLTLREGEIVKLTDQLAQKDVQITSLTSDVASGSEKLSACQAALSQVQATNQTLLDKISRARADLA